MAELDRLLDAAEEVIQGEGLGRLRLEAVARRAGMSKGGLLHHFPSKDALVDALMARRTREWRAEVEAAIAAQPPGPGRVPRAILALCLSSAAEWSEARRRSCQVCLTALVHDPQRVEPMRALNRELQARLAADRLPPGVGDAVLLAVDGLWFGWLLGVAEPTPARLEQVRAALERWVADTEGQMSERSPSRSRVRARRSKAAPRRAGKRKGGRA
mgnify:CR=1 FL=1